MKICCRWDIAFFKLVQLTQFPEENRGNGFLLVKCAQQEDVKKFVLLFINFKRASIKIVTKVEEKEHIQLLYEYSKICKIMLVEGIRNPLIHWLNLFIYLRLDVNIHILTIGCYSYTYEYSKIRNIQRLHVSYGQYYLMVFFW